MFEVLQVALTATVVVCCVLVLRSNRNLEKSRQELIRALLDDNDRRDEHTKAIRDYLVSVKR